MSTNTSEVYYDPYDFDIDDDPYPVFKRMRDEQPLYYNEKHDFYALTRFSDVEGGLRDNRRLISGRGTILELLKADIELPAGMVIFEDQPSHTAYRGLLSRVFTPSKMAALEPQIRKFCADSLDEVAGNDEFDLIHDLGGKMPMRVIGMLLGIPESDQESLKHSIDEGLRLETGDMPELDMSKYENELDVFGGYLDWRVDHPSDDLMTALIQAEFEDHTGTVRHLSRDEILGYVRLLAGAGNETTTKLIGWTGKVMSDHPDQRREIVADRSLVKGAIEEVLRFEAPSPAQARYVDEDIEYYGQVVPTGSAMLLINASGNRDDRKYDEPDTFNIRRGPRISRSDTASTSV
jgi:cytochrome P450